MNTGSLINPKNEKLLSVATFKIANFPVPINARYVVSDDVEIKLDDGTTYVINSKQKMTINRIINNGDTAVLRWIDFSAGKSRACELSIYESHELLDLLHQI